MKLLNLYFKLNDTTKTRCWQEDDTEYYFVWKKGTTAWAVSWTLHNVEESVKLCKHVAVLWEQLEHNQQHKNIFVMPHLLSSKCLLWVIEEDGERCGCDRQPSHWDNSDEVKDNWQPWKNAAQWVQRVEMLSKEVEESVWGVEEYLPKRKNTCPKKEEYLSKKGRIPPKKGSWPPDTGYSDYRP